MSKTDGSAENVSKRKKADGKQKTTRTARACAAAAELRVAETVRMICDGQSIAQIRKHFRKKYGLQRRQTLHYVALARVRMRSELEGDVRDLAAKHYAIYMGVVADPHASIRDKLNAMKQADQLLGLRGPIKITTASAGNEAIYRKALEGMTRDELRVLAKANRRLKEVVAGQTTVDAVSVTERPLVPR